MSEQQWEPTTEAGRAIIDAIVAAPDRTLLATDFDGTLSPIVDDPASATFDDSCRAALARLLPRLGRVAVVTGRGAETVRDLGRLDAPEMHGIVVLGQYGVERLDTTTGELRLPPAPTEVALAHDGLRDLLVELQRVGVDVQGVHLEDKGRAIAVHTRRASSPDEVFAALREPVANLAERLGLVLEPGKQVLELRASTTTKADALHELVAETRPEVVVFIGDDLGDLAAMEALHDLDATTAAVVSGSAEQPAMREVADVLADGPAGVGQWLATLADRLGA